MRKCDACGYLLLGDGDSCNHCGAPLATVTVAAPASAAPAPAPPAPAAPAVPAPVPPRPLPVSPPPGPAPVWSPGSPTSPLGSIAPPAPPPPPGGPPRDIWRPAPEPIATMAPPKKRKTGRIVLAGIVLVLGAFVAYGAYARNQPPAGTGDFVAGHGVEYTAADGSYTTQFPKEPVVDTKPVPINGVQLTSNSATVESGAYEMLTISMALPAPIPADRIDQALDDGVNSGVAGANGKLKSKQRLTRGGFPAVDATLEMPDSYGARVLIVVTNTHLYILAVHAKTGVDKLFHALDKSFVPNIAV